MLGRGHINRPGDPLILIFFNALELQHVHQATFTEKCIGDLQELALSLSANIHILTHLALRQEHALSVELPIVVLYHVVLRPRAREVTTCPILPYFGCGRESECDHCLCLAVQALALSEVSAADQLQSTLRAGEDCVVCAVFGLSEIGEYGVCDEGLAVQGGGGRQFQQGCIIKQHIFREEPSGGF